MQCIVKVDQTEIDVVKLYRDHGYTTLPPQLTITGAHLRQHGKVDPAYRVYRDGDMTNAIEDMTALPVMDGDKFCSVPPATWGPTHG